MAHLPVYKVEHIFQDIEGDPDNVLMTIPPEVMEEAGIQPGDTIEITSEEHAICIKKVES